MVFVYDWGEQLTKDDLPLDSAGDDCVKSTHIECRRDNVKVLTDIDYRKCTTAAESVKQGFLRLVLSTRCLASAGSTSQKQHLVKLIIKMLDEKDDIQKIVSIIKSYKQLSKTYCARLETTLKCIMEDSSEVETSQLCIDAIAHLTSLNTKTKKKRSE